MRPIQKIPKLASFSTAVSAQNYNKCVICYPITSKDLPNKTVTFNSVDKSGWRHVALNKDHTTFVTGKGDVYVHNATDPETALKKVEGLPPILHVDCGGSHTVALSEDGRVFDWGVLTAAEEGGVGSWFKSAFRKKSSDSASDPAKPRELKLPEGVKEIVCGAAHSLALTSTGKVYAWGLASQGVLGPHPPHSDAEPVLIPMLPPVSYISAGNLHNAVIVDGQVFTWGSDDRGQAGQAHSTAEIKKFESYPAQVTGPGLEAEQPMESVACGHDHTVSRSKTNDIFFWGSGIWVAPQKAWVPSKPVVSMSARGAISAFVTEDGFLTLWTGRSHFKSPQRAEKLKDAIFALRAVCGPDRVAVFGR